MRVAVAHNFYQQPGGEDQVFSAEAELLSSRGQPPLHLVRHNHAVSSMGYVAAFRASIWSGETARELRQVIRRERLEVVHFHNTFPLISPAAYYAATAEGAAVVQTLHNFRLICPNALLFREGRTCENCVGQPVACSGLLRGCYRNSRAATAAVVAMQSFHRLFGTWKKKVDVYIALTNSSREKLIRGGLPAEKIAVKANFLDPDPGIGEGLGGHGVFVGRLSPEKGLRTMLAGWDLLKTPPALRILGDGPEAPLVKAATSRHQHIEWLGRQPLEKVLQMIGDAGLVIFPAQCYENFPRTIVEAFAKGTPVIASNLGAMAELIEHGRTGLLFEPGNPEDLAAKVQEFLAYSPARKAEMRKACRAEYLAKYTADRNYNMLMDIYQLAIERAKARR